MTNFGDIEQPEDRGILLKDILETGETDREKGRAVIASIGRTTTREYFDKQQGTMSFEPVGTTKDGKAYCLTSGYSNGSGEKIGNYAAHTLEKGCKSMVAEPVRIPEYGDGNKARPINAYYSNNCGGFEHRMFSPNPNKQQVDMIAEPIRVGCMPSPNGEIKNSQAKRIYSVVGKSVNLVANGGGEGAKSGLCAIPVNTTKDSKSQTIKAQYQQTSPDNILGYTSTYGASGVAEPIGYAIPCEQDENGKPTKAISCADGKTHTVYEVKDGQITIKGKQYPIKLVDGYYIIRKLTVRECARLQTMPDDYCKAVSDSQAYKALGNGWTAEVIIHLLNHALKDIPRDEEIVVLSLYDGIATGRYCLDKMGFTNVTYHAYEIDKYPIQIAMDNYPDIIQHRDAFAVREDNWKAPQTRSEWLDELLGA